MMKSLIDALAVPIVVVLYIIAWKLIEIVFLLEHSTLLGLH